MIKRHRYQISIISPVYNEEKNLLPLYGKLNLELNKLKLSWEIIFVDDGSSDHSLEILQKLAKNDRKVKIIQFSRNFGQTAAIVAGAKQSLGNVIVIIDADLQNDPRDIKKLLEKMDEGFDVVSGWRKQRKDPFLTRVLPSVIANKIISKVVGIHLHDYGCTLKAYRREILQKVSLYGEMHRLIPAYAAFQGAKITEVVVRHNARKFGRSNYNLWRVVKLLFDLATLKFLNDFSTKPLHLFGGFGLSVFFSGVMIFIIVAVRVFFFQGGWISPLILLSGLMVILSFQFLLIGLLAEILVRIYFESHKTTPYVIRKTVNFS